jgi:hypothetical protein
MCEEGHPILGYNWFQVSYRGTSRGFCKSDRLSLNELIQDQKLPLNDQTLWLSVQGNLMGDYVMPVPMAGLEEDEEICAACAEKEGFQTSIFCIWGHSTC